MESITMPTFTAIAFDRLIEPGGSRAGHQKSASISVPVAKKLERRTSEPPTSRKRVPPRPQLKPSLYATPEVTPLPDTPLQDSPSSFPPSPYIINHKRRGPRLLKSFSEANVQAKQEIDDDGNVNGKSPDSVVSSSAGDLQVTFVNSEPVTEEQASSVEDNKLSSSNGGDVVHSENGSSIDHNGVHLEKVVVWNSERDGESEDFFDPNDSMSFTSYTDGEDNTGTDRTAKYSTAGEFFDAWEELSSDGGTHGSLRSLRDVDAELREIRLSLLMEIEKRKHVEESLKSMQSQWERIREGLSSVGIVLPADLAAIAEAEQLNSDPVDDLCQQVYIARFVSNTIGRGTARAEAEAEMEAQLDSKNFEISRLLERLHYYETMNREMSQRNQAAIETARRERQRRSRRQRWIWGSITTAIVLGTTAIAWSYLPSSKGSTSADHDDVSEHNDAAN
ncbi:hypothetical protein TSUD_211530 [Trifolium subterraneum]|uniref:Uncharacterized protein n=1 Tax=Trifolium subterraneum TaxID=3900 RepID=A0A2Z6NJA4_TRISU|nr:hypothetical protein TSUD_211530 [Trifolium subterraneum]